MKKPWTEKQVAEVMGWTLNENSCSFGTSEQGMSFIGFWNIYENDKKFRDFVNLKMKKGAL